MASLLKWIIAHIAPVFIITSPVTSYADQIWSMNKNRSSAGFSLDIPLIMLVSSILKYTTPDLETSPFSRLQCADYHTRVFYWLGARYDFPLLIQASVMIGVQIILLHYALVHRPPFGAQHSLNKPFVGAHEEDQLVSRPYRFWQWRSRKPYWQFLAYYAATLTLLQYVVGASPIYIALQGYVALGVEAVLPIPQVLENSRSRSCQGFRLSVLANWLIGDVFKMTYFFLSDGGIPWAFKLCGLFQAACDCYLGVQYWMYGNVESVVEVKEKIPRLA